MSLQTQRLSKFQWWENEFQLGCVQSALPVGLLGDNSALISVSSNDLRIT